MPGMSGFARAQPERNWRRRHLGTLGVVVVVLGLSSPAAVSAGDGDRAAAKAHYEAATKYYDLHEYEDAAKEYKAAYFAKPDPAFLFNIGQCYKRLGKSDQAVDFFREYLKKAPLDEPNRANAEARIRELESAIPDTSPRGSPQPSPAAAPPLEKHTSPVAPPAAAADPRLLESGPSMSPSVGSPYYAAPPPTARQPVGAELATAAPPEAPKTGTPFYRTWWFWTGVGAAVVVGTVTAILLTRGGSEPNSATAGLGTQGVFQ